MRLKNRSILSLAISLILLSATAGCGSNSRGEEGEVKNPLLDLQRKANAYDQYSIILDDMNISGNFSRSYEHKYKLVMGKMVAGTDSLTWTTETTPWRRVHRSFYRRHEANLGMVLASKDAEGKVSNDIFPPGYNHVGDTRYGRWVQGSGGSFWEWYGKYALFSTMFNMMRGPVYRSDYDNYYRYRSSGRPYYSSGRYGTTGTVTKKSRPNYYQRAEARQRAARSTFQSRVKKRVRRSNMSGYRSRSRSFGGK
jgi:hypothetical protein